MSSASIRNWSRTAPILLPSAKGGLSDAADGAAEARFSGRSLCGVAHRACSIRRPNRPASAPSSSIQDSARRRRQRHAAALRDRPGTAGFNALSLMATMPGVPFYARGGYRAEAPVTLRLGDIAVPFTPMSKRL